MSGPDFRWEDGLLVHPRHGAVAKLVRGKVIKIKHQNETKKVLKKPKGKCKNCAYGWIDDSIGRLRKVICGVSGRSMSWGTFYNSNDPEDICSEKSFCGDGWMYEKRKTGKKMKRGDHWGPYK